MTAEARLDGPEAVTPRVSAGADAQKVRAALPHAVLDIVERAGDVWLFVDRTAIRDTLRYLRDELAYRFFSECMCVDYLDPGTGSPILGKRHRFEVIYNLVSLAEEGGSRPGPARRLFVKVPVPGEDPAVPSVTDVYPGAAFPEREIFDMFGVRFEGHPDLRRLLMPDDWIGHPQRKDYPLGGERVQFPNDTYGPSVGEKVVQHPGEGFFGRTADEIE